MKSKKINYIDDDYPQSLLKINKYPKKLFYIGNKSILLHKRIIAIVGSRDCTDYGRKYANIFSKELAQKDICIISGLAIGIDAAAHVGSMAEKGGTIAVLAGGLQNIYPKENKWIFDEIIENSGCIITEHDDYTETVMTDFPMRNRIISGISDAVLVVEARHRSGTVITANFAKNQGKKIYCIPNNLDSPTGTGVNELIARGAMPVMSANQIINDLYKIKQLSIEDNKTNNTFLISEKYKKIYTILSKKDSTIDELSRILQINTSKLNSIVTMMELENYIVRKPGNRFSINK